MAGESARRVFEQERARRRVRFRKVWPWLLVGVMLAFAVGWVAPSVVLSWMRTLAEPTGMRADPSSPFTTAHWPYSAMSALVCTAYVGSILLAPSRREAAWRKGWEGEKIVGDALDALGRDGRCHALHDRTIPGSRANIDHLIVTPAGVFTVDAKRYAGRLQVRGRGREIWVNGRNRSKIIEQAYRQVRAVETVLAHAGLSDVPVRPVLCFVGTRLPGRARTRRADGVALLSPRELRVLLPREEVHDGVRRAAIVAALDAGLVPAAPGDVDTDGTRREPRPTSSNAASAPATQCGRCGQSMVLRTRRSDGGRFLGCSAFPRCRYTATLDAGPPSG